MVFPSSRTTRRWRGAKNWLLALGVLVVCDFAFAQVAKVLLPDPNRQAEQARQHRVRSPIYHHDLRKLAESTAYWGDRKVAYFTNSLGFRDRAARTVPLQSDARRLLFIGDSFTEAVGVEYGDSFVGLIDAALAPCGIEALNAAVVSYSPSIYYRKVRHLIEDVGLDFDEVVVFLDISDIEDEAVLYDIDAAGNVIDSPGSPLPDVFIREQGGEVEPQRSAAGLLVENSVILRLVDLAAKRFGGGRPPVARPAPAAAGATGLTRASWTFDEPLFEFYGRRGLEQATRAMDRLLGQLRAHGKALTLVVYPWPDQIAAGDLESKQVTWWRGWAEQHRIRFVNVFPALIGAGDPERIIERYFIRGDVHLNEAGHRLLAHEFLKARDDLQGRCETVSLPG